MRPKSSGKALHVSGFCCSCHGFITDEATNKSSFEIMTPGFFNVAIIFIAISSSNCNANIIVR